MEPDEQFHEVTLDAATYGPDGSAVSFEPTGMQYAITESERLRVRIRGHGTGVVEVVHLPDGIVIGEWAGAETDVWDTDGRPLPL